MVKPTKIIIFSHENDIDGLGSIILCKLAFGNIDYVLSSNVNILETKFRKMLENGALYQYDRIYITDLALYNPSLEMVSKDSILSSKVLVFDHHKSAINEGYDRYDFTTIIVADENGIKKCGTELFYSYLVSNGLLSKTPALDEFTELTRLEDTWEWKQAGLQGQKAHDMAIFLNIVGIERYIEIMYTKVYKNRNTIEFTEKEKQMITNKKIEYLTALQDIWSSREYFLDEFNNKYAGVFADYEYRNELGEYVRSLNESDIKYLVIIALEKGTFGQKSYRAIRDGFDVGKIAESHGGYGHSAAASVSITEEQRNKSLILRKKSNRDSLEYLINSSYTE